MRARARLAVSVQGIGWKWDRSVGSQSAVGTARHIRPSISSHRAVLRDRTQRYRRPGKRKSEFHFQIILAQRSRASLILGLHYGGLCWPEAPDQFHVRVCPFQVEFNVSFEGLPSPKISWYKDGLEIFSNRCQKISTEGCISTLIIYEACISDESEIKCSATNRVGYAVTKAYLKVEGK